MAILTVLIRQYVLQALNDDPELPFSDPRLVKLMSPSSELHFKARDRLERIRTRIVGQSKS